MGKITETVQTVNSAVRTFLAVVLVGGAGLGGLTAFNKYTERDRELQESTQALQTTKNELAAAQKTLAEQLVAIQNLEEDVAAKQATIERLETAMALLKVDRRLARLEVVSQSQEEATGLIRSKIRFIELSPNGDVIGDPKEFEISGNVVYVDNWIVKFDDRYIESSDLQRGTSLCLFRRIFGENQTPMDGYSLDEVGMRPQVYARGGSLSDFEKLIWRDFWEFANDPRRAAEMGIRAANGEAVSMQVKEGMSYNIELRASGGLSITPIER